MKANNIEIKKSRERTIAAFLALFLGGIGIQKFYIGQIFLGVLCVIFSFTFIPMVIGIVDFMRFMLMSDEEFDLKYNSVNHSRPLHRTKNGTIVFKKNERDGSGQFEYTTPQTVKKSFTGKMPAGVPLKLNKHAQEADEYFQDYRYREALEAYKEAIKTSPGNATLYFNMACCNSLLEQKKDLFENLQLAIRSGFRDLDKISSTDALAYFRIQPEYDEISKSGFTQWPVGENAQQSRTQSATTTQHTETPAEPSMDDLLVQLKKLGELRQNGVLTEEEFLTQKRKLFA